jgi:hypothetical protein
MPFDAKALFWPSTGFRSFFDRIEAIKLDPGAVEVSALKSIVNEFQPWLLQGLEGFKTPNDASRKAIETESTLSVGSQKMPVEAGLRSPTLTVATALVGTT